MFRHAMDDTTRRVIKDVDSVDGESSLVCRYLLEVVDSELVNSWDDVDIVCPRTLVE